MNYATANNGTNVYRIELQYPDKKIGVHTIPGKRRVIPMATKQRLGCVLSYQSVLPDSERAEITVYRAPVGEWELMV